MLVLAFCIKEGLVHEFLNTEVFVSCCIVPCAFATPFQSATLIRPCAVQAPRIDSPGATPYV